MFELKDKVAIVTGGAEGIGHAYVKEFLQNGLKGVAIIDVNKVQGNSALEEFNKEFGPNKVIFICADVSNKLQLREAFEETVAVFQQLDILVNNAAIVDEINWEKCIGVNLVAVIEASTLAMRHFFPKYKSGHEGVILNTASTAAFELYKGLIVYTSTKCGVIGFTRQVGATCSDMENVRIMAICPGGTDTSIARLAINGIPKEHVELAQSSFKNVFFQPPEEVASAAIKIIKTAYSGSVWSISEGKLVEMDKLPIM